MLGLVYLNPCLLYTVWMSKSKARRNARIVRLREMVRSGGVLMSWGEIAERIAIEFPDDGVTRARVRVIYMRETSK